MQYTPTLVWGFSIKLNEYTEHSGCCLLLILYKQAGVGGFELVCPILIELYWTSDVFEMK